MKRWLKEWWFPTGTILAGVIMTIILVRLPNRMPNPPRCPAGYVEIWTQIEGHQRACVPGYELHDDN